MAKSGDTDKAAALIRDYGRNEVPVDFLEKKLGVERSEAVALLRQLSYAGYGELILGRKGGKTRIRKAEVLPVSAGPTTPDSLPLVASETAEYQVFSLRRPMPFPIKVPADLTVAEAEKLGAWLKLIVEDDKSR